MLAFGFNPATMQLWHEGADFFPNQKNWLRKGVVFFFRSDSSFGWDP